MKEKAQSVGERIAEKISRSQFLRYPTTFTDEKKAHVAALIDQELSRVAEENADTARLDWLQKQSTQRLIDLAWRCVNLRAAIDAARAKDLGDTLKARGEIKRGIQATRHE